MSTLGESLKDLRSPSKKHSNFRIWLDSLSSEDRSLALDALQDADLKTHPLHTAFRANGMRVSKDYFVNLRNQILAGTLVVGDIR